MLFIQLQQGGDKKQLGSETHKTGVYSKLGNDTIQRLGF